MNGYASFLARLIKKEHLQMTQKSYLKTQVAGKAKLALGDFAYSNRGYNESLRVLEQKNGQSQSDVSAPSKNLSVFHE